MCLKFIFLQEFCAPQIFNKYVCIMKMFSFTMFVFCIKYIFIRYVPWIFFYEYVCIVKTF